MAITARAERHGPAPHEAELDRLLAEGRAFSAEFPLFLANHLPMMLVALHRLGGSDERLAEFFAIYRDTNRLVPMPTAVAPIERADWTSALGDRSARARLPRLLPRARSADSAIAPRSPPTSRRLIRGIAASATHAFMRLAYGVLRNDPAEVGAALGYWSAIYLSLGRATGAPPITDDPGEVLLRLQPMPTPSARSRRRWTCSGTSCGRWPRSRNSGGWSTGCAIGPDSLRRVAAASLALYAATMDFCALHALTGAHWLRLITPVAARPRAGAPLFLAGDRLALSEDRLPRSAFRRDARRRGATPIVRTGRRSRPRAVKLRRRARSQPHLLGLRGVEGLWRPALSGRRGAPGAAHPVSERAVGSRLAPTPPLPRGGRIRGREAVRILREGGTRHRPASSPERRLATTGAPHGQAPTLRACLRARSARHCDHAAMSGEAVSPTRSLPTASASMSASARDASPRSASRWASDGPGERIDLAGALLLPGFVDGHIHLDKTLLGLPFQPHRPGDTVAERITREKELRRELAYPIEERAKRLIAQVVAHGTTALRSHVDIDPEVRLGGLDALLPRARGGRAISSTSRSSPFRRAASSPGRASTDLLDQAIRAGADLVGGLDPAGIDNDVNGSSRRDLRDRRAAWRRPRHPSARSGPARLLRAPPDRRPDARRPGSPAASR